MTSWSWMKSWMPKKTCQTTQTSPAPTCKDSSAQTELIKPATPAPAAVPVAAPAPKKPDPALTKRKQPEASNPPAKRSKPLVPVKPASSRAPKPAVAKGTLNGEKSAAHIVVIADNPQADPRDILKAVSAAHTLPQGVVSALDNKLQDLKVRELSQLPGDKSVRVAHRSPTRNGTCTAFIELDLASYKAIGRRGRIILDHVILNYEESARVCYRCCGYGHNADRCTKSTVTCFHCASGDHQGRSCPTLANPRTANYSSIPSYNRPGETPNIVTFLGPDHESSTAPNKPSEHHIPTFVSSHGEVQCRPAPQAVNVNIGYVEAPNFKPEEEDIENYVEELKTWLADEQSPGRRLDEGPSEFSPFKATREALWALAPKDCLLLAAAWSTTRNPEESEFIQAAIFLDETNKWERERKEASESPATIPTQTATRTAEEQARGRKQRAETPTEKARRFMLPDGTPRCFTCFQTGHKHWDCPKRRPRDDHAEWTKFVKSATFAFNSSVQSSTKVTPHRIVFGIEPRTSLDAGLPTMDEPIKTFDKYVTDRILENQRLKDMARRPKIQRTDENVQKITDLIKENPRTTLLELEQDTGISKTTIGRIVTEDLKLKKTPAKFIPRFLTNEQKLCRLATCEDMMEMTRTDSEWKDKIITGDETWVYGYDPETKPQSAEWRDIAPNDFFLFPKLKAVLKGRHFDTRDDIIEKSPLALKSIPKEAYKNCFDNWEKRWRCGLEDHLLVLEETAGRVHY
ncbi:hypothetical protein LAZ67_5003046 [Cordylochernes scorpioides]|uniref:CCHC-type domain-containing protein n=1 Tax=Cordylochernes scorpioides TaxID=51811 RepID=A0ABY6KGX9_9ARAC|nr:hypothetical protein LAZ67_5003046 [Cordylochernes scorpioides]